MNKPIFTSAEWTFPLIEETWAAIQEVAKDVCPLDYFPAQIELISAEDMLDAYSSVAMPVMYKHWSFGKSFVKNEQAYKKGQMGLAYEVVINTNPCLAYLMENNTMTMQALVLAHASVGHSSFFKNNYLFKEWTEPDTILDFLQYAKDYINKMEKKHGEFHITNVLDACHALQLHGVNKYKRPDKKSKKEAEKIKIDRENYERESFNDLWRTAKTPGVEIRERQEEFLSILKDWETSGGKFPEENLLSFLAANTINHTEEIKEIIRIVQKVAQYFYPQMQTQLMNEGWASFNHYNIMTEMRERGYITEGSYLEFLDSHVGVLYQPSFNSPYYSGINPYALGFAMFKDIRRICENPTEEDIYWFPEIAGKDWKEVTAHAVKNFRDESFVLQFLSPKVIRDFKLFSLGDDPNDPDTYYKVKNVHSDEDIHNIRVALSQQYSITEKVPQIDIINYDEKGDRGLYLRYMANYNKKLDYQASKLVASHMEFLWGFPIYIEYYDADGYRMD